MQIWLTLNDIVFIFYCEAISGIKRWCGKALFAGVKVRFEMVYGIFGKVTLSFPLCSGEWKELLWTPLCSQISCSLTRQHSKWMFIRRFESKLGTINNSLVPSWLITHLKSQLVVSELSPWQQKRTHKRASHAYTHACISPRPPAHST